jgi:hypothetical protein
MLEYHNKPDKIPGEEFSTSEKVLCQGSSLLEKFDPINQICDHLVGLHCYASDPKRQVIAHHYCSAINKEFRQCLLYDSDRKDAKLIGVEYIISNKLFSLLPEEEKKLWHTHVHEIKSGILSIPNVPYTIEHKVMEVLIGTYGKTIQLWQIDRGDLIPVGLPQIMMSPTNDSIVNWELIKKRDDLLGLKTDEIRKNRADICTPSLESGADQWVKTGKGINLEVVENKLDLQ